MLHLNSNTQAMVLIHLQIIYTNQIQNQFLQVHSMHSWISSDMSEHLSTMPWDEGLVGIYEMHVLHAVLRFNNLPYY